MWDNAPSWRKVMNIMMSILMLMGGYAGYVVLQRPDFFPMQHVTLGASLQRVLPADVLKVVRRELHGNFFTADITHLRLALEKLPWVRHINVRRDFPNRIVVELEEYQALARWNHHELINQHGELFMATNVKLKELPLFIAPDGTERQVVLGYLKFNQQLAGLQLSIKQLTLSPRHAWQLRLSNDIVLELGRNEMTQRLERFVTVYPYSLANQPKTVKQVDLRYRNGMAVQL